jgi:uncharacterized protein (TIGR00369 family)
LASTGNHYLKFRRNNTHLPFRPELVGDPRHNRWHGGILSALIDSAGGAAAITTMVSEKDQVSSIDLRVDFMKAGKPMDVLAEGRVVKDGNSVLFAQMKVWHEETGEVIAEGRGVFRVRREEAADPIEINVEEVKEKLSGDAEQAPTEQ